jgi:hypothetical protein
VAGLEPRARLAPWIASLLAPAGLLALVAALAPGVPIDGSTWLVAAGILAFACVGAEVLTAAGLAPRLPARALLWLPLPIGTLVAVAVAGPALPRLLAAALVTSALLAVGTLLGSVVGAAIDHPGHLIVVAVVSALVDAFSVLHPSGPTAQLVQVQAAIDVLILPWPILGTDRIEPILGVGDIAFAAIYAAAARRHGLPLRRTLAALAAGLCVTLVVVLVTGMGIPALPFLGAAVVIAHPEARRLPAADRKKALLGLAFLLALFAALFALRS